MKPGEWFDALRKIGSAGMPALHTECRIVDPESGEGAMISIPRDSCARIPGYNAEGEMDDDVADRPQHRCTVEDLRVANASYGLGFRLHSHKTTTMRLDAAHGREGWRVSFSLNDPFRLRRLTRHTAAVPFVP